MKLPFPKQEKKNKTISLFLSIAVVLLLDLFDGNKWHQFLCASQSAEHYLHFFTEEKREKLMKWRNWSQVIHPASDEAKIWTCRSLNSESMFLTWGYLLLCTHNDLDSF